MSINELLEQTVSDLLGEQIRIRSARAVSGGCIHDSRQIELNDGRRYFGKQASGLGGDMLRTERYALQSLRETNTIRVPQVIGIRDQPNGTTILLMEWIESTPPDREFYLRLAEQLVELHKNSSPEGRYGFDQDNFIGATPQKNGWHGRWSVFFRQQRLLDQLELAARNGLADAAMMELGNRVADNIEAFLPESPVPSLLHGDLWSGNYLCDENQQPVLIDPATFFGDREYEFGMIELFGKLPDQFHTHYAHCWPFPTGFERRIQLYKLFHLLNHLNLFGPSYHATAMKIFKQLAQQIN